MTPTNRPKFVILAILDGWGLAPDSAGNAITGADTPNMDKIWVSYPHTQLQASGDAVGLPKGEDGNTETGHLNLGAGRIVYQDLERINMAIADGSFFENKALNSAITHAKKFNSNLHIMGLIGAGGAHSNIEHLFALIHLASLKNLKNFYIHLFTDGRDSPPTSAKSYIKRLEEVINKEGVGTIASVMGRYWAMDRDQRWDRTEIAYFALTAGVGNLVKNPIQAIEASYANGQTDEFIKPTLIAKDNKAVGLISDNDSVVFFNFRIDRPRQLTKAFILRNFTTANILFDYDPYHTKYAKGNIEKPRAIMEEPFKRGKPLNNLYFVTMTEYSKPLREEGAIPAFPPEIVGIPISAVFSTAGLRQLKITESEKEHFVTFYLNGLRERPFPLEDNLILPSAKVPTYDLKPEMAAYEITETLLKRVGNSDYSLVVVNYPNADMVGHTGNIGATLRGVEVVDDCIGKLINFVLAYNGYLVVTADHGNAEEMINLATNQIDTEHSTFPVPFITVSKDLIGRSQTLRTGILADVAPTIISIMGLTVPSNMTGRNLLADLHDN